MSNPTTALRSRVAATPSGQRARRWLSRHAAQLSGRLGPVREAVPAGSAPISWDEFALEVHEWSVFHDRLFVHFQLSARGTQARPTRAFVVLHEVAIELPATVLDGGAGETALPAVRNDDLRLGFELDDGRFVVVDDPANYGLTADPAGQLFGRFASELQARPPGRALEIGSRARSGTIYRDALVPATWDYTGVDIREGPNVDVVGDAHDLAACLGDQRFDAAYSIATFEHLAMPWKAAVEINRVLNDGGLVYIGSHQAFPMHERPWDFWRYSDQAWRALFNASTGFEVLEAALGEPANVVATFAKTALTGTWNQPAFLTSGVLAQKVGPAEVDWSIPLDTILSEVYPN